MSNWHQNEYGKLCNCQRSDAWRCAREKNDPGVACHCACHNYIRKPRKAPEAPHASK